MEAPGAVSSTIALPGETEANLHRERGRDMKLGIQIGRIGGPRAEMRKLWRLPTRRPRT
jgi:hypothetical protein